MANETRPRREPSGTSRIRKSTASTPPPAADGESHRREVDNGGSDLAAVHLRIDSRPRTDAARAVPRRKPPPIASRFDSSASPDRDREPAPDRAERTEREPSGSSIRERLVRDRGDRDAGPVHHEGIPIARDRDRESAPVRERVRDARDAESSGNRDRDA